MNRTTSIHRLPWLPSAMVVAVVALIAPPGAMAAARPSPYTYRPASAQIPACAQAGAAISFPRDFPTRFPMPRHSAITSSAHLSPHGARLSGVIPLSTIAQGRAFFTQQLPKVGFTIVMSDSEPGREAESGFTGHGWVGHWRVRVIPDCAGVLAFSANAIH